MVRPRWHGPAIAVWVLALAVAGALALWGEDLRDWWRSGNEPAPAEQPGKIPGDIL
jgi:hypothetical protein